MLKFVIVTSSYAKAKQAHLEKMLVKTYYTSIGVP
jgi:hypothetical protein